MNDFYYEDMPDDIFGNIDDYVVPYDINDPLQWFNVLENRPDVKNCDVLFSSVLRRRQQESHIIHPTLFQYTYLQAIKEVEFMVNN